MRPIRFWDGNGEHAKACTAYVGRKRGAAYEAVLHMSPKAALLETTKLFIDNILDQLKSYSTGRENTQAKA